MLQACTVFKNWKDTSLAVEMCPAAKKYGNNAPVSQQFALLVLRLCFQLLTQTCWLGCEEDYTRSGASASPPQRKAHGTWAFTLHPSMELLPWPQLQIWGSMEWDFQLALLTLSSSLVLSTRV